MKTKEDEITITITGTKKFRQTIVDLIYQVLMVEDIEVQVSRDQRNLLKLESTMEPSEEVMP